MPSRMLFTARLAPVLVGLALAVAAVLNLQAECEGQVSEQTPAEEERIQACIERLGAGSWAERNEAFLELVKAGPAAFEALFRASRRARDPEVRHQARLILTDNLWKGLPNYLADEFLGFFEKGVEERRQVLQRLLFSPELERGKLRTYLLRAFLYDPSAKVREDALDFLDRKGLLLDRELLLRLARWRPEPDVLRNVGMACSRNGFAKEAVGLLAPLAKEPPGGDPALSGALALALACAGRAKEAAPLAAAVFGAISTSFDRTALAFALIDGGESGALLDAHPWEQAGEEERLFFAAALEAKGRHGEAAGVLRLGNPGAEGVLLTRILARAGKWDQALEQLADSSKALGLDGPTVLVQVRILSFRGHSKGALDFLVSRGNGQTPPLTALERVRILLDLGRAEDASALIESKEFLDAVREGPSLACRGAAELACRAGTPGIASRLLDCASKPGEDLTAWLDTKLAVFDREKKPDEALQQLLAVFTDFQHIPEHERLSRMILERAGAGKGLDALAGRIEASIEKGEKAWRLRARVRPAWLGLYDEGRCLDYTLLGRLRALQGRASEARMSMNRAHELAPHSLENLVVIDRIRVEGMLDDDISEEFFTRFLGPSGRPAGLSVPSPAECVRFLWFSARACDARWEEEIIPNLPPGALPRFSASIRSLLPGPPVPILLPAFPEFGAKLWRWRLGKPDATFTDEARIRGALHFAAIGGPKAGDLLLHLARVGEGRVRDAAANRLFTLQGAASPRDLVRLMRRGIGDFDWQVRVARVLARGPLGPAAEDLERMAGDEKSRLRPVAAWLLLRSGKARFASVLKEVAGNDEASLEARRFACLALSPLSDESCGALFRGILSSEHRSLRMAAAVALAGLGDPEGQAAVVRELRWLFRNGDEDWTTALVAASTIGGADLGRALVLGLRAGTIPREDLLLALADMGGPREGEWVRVLDLFPFLGAGADGLLGPVLDALADFGSPAEAREGLVCLRESFSPGAMTPEDRALAARLALRAGLDEEARAWFLRARAGLFGREEASSIEARIKLFCAFGEKPEDALRDARDLVSRHGGASWTVSLLARALFASGRRDEARRILDGVLSDLPLPGRAGLVRLRSSLFPD